MAEATLVRKAWPLVAVFVLALVAFGVVLRVLNFDTAPKHVDGTYTRAATTGAYPVLARAVEAPADAGWEGSWVLLQTAPLRWSLLGGTATLAHVRAGDWHVFRALEGPDYLALRPEPADGRSARYVLHRLAADGPRTEEGRAAIVDPAALAALTPPAGLQGAAR